MLSVDAIGHLHQSTTQRWHEEPTSCQLENFMQLVCDQHRFNFLLWHEEDIARSPDVNNAQLAAVKRSIDLYNQKRNDAIELIDAAIASYLQSQGVTPEADVPLNSETPGSIIDRLSILSLRIFHLKEQLHRDDISESLRQSVLEKIEIASSQQADLKNCLAELWNDLVAGCKRHKIYRQLKMYNDPNLNPYLYNNQGREL